MRRTLIQFWLPLVFSAVPTLAAALVVATLPPIARTFYLGHFTPLDGVIVGLGLGLFLIQTVLGFRAMQWRGRGFDERPDMWLNQLAQSSEWFPLLGLIGTVAGILQTFSSITGSTPPAKIIQLYAPAITATGSGLFMALLNILPIWMAMVGRGLIAGLGGEEPPAAVASVPQKPGGAA
ncbi:MAG: MotA/TolQ/ExbB proton channel family protein [Gemmataceae bacterium]